MAHPSRRTTALGMGLMVWGLWGWLVLAPVAAHAGPAGPSGRPLSAESVRRAVAAMPSRPQTSRSAPDWSRVERLTPGTHVVAVIDGRPPLDGEVVSADSAGLTVRGPGGLAERALRADVAEVRDLTRRGSKRNAVIGAGAGAFLGYLIALNVAFRDCGGGCGDERALIGVALVGTPVAGGLLGYHAFACTSQLVYRRPSP
jgi:hypothetical protein